LEGGSFFEATGNFDSFCRWQFRGRAYVQGEILKEEPGFWDEAGPEEEASLGEKRIRRRKQPRGDSGSGGATLGDEAGPEEEGFLSRD